MVLKLYDTLTRSKKEVAGENGLVTMYVCGLTPQSEVHVGHIRTFVVFDLIRRIIERSGLRTLHVQNFTDIDDKIIARAKELKIQPSELAEKNIVEYFDVVDKLGLLRAHIYPRVTDHVDEIIGAVKELIRKGNAYQADGDVYFDVRSFPEYGKLSHQTLADLVAGARVEPSPIKRRPEDFALWKAAKPGEPSWKSPWGPGRPGWHIECTVMAVKYLGETLAIHGGGQDLIFPHHENEIAQTESLTGKTFSKMWVHVGWVTMMGEKMSKSVGNVVPVSAAIQKWAPEVVKLALLSVHYRSPLEFGEPALQQTEAFVDRFRKTYFRLLSLAPRAAGESDNLPSEVSSLFAQFEAALDDDLNTPVAFAKVSEIIRIVNKALDSGEVSEESARVVKKTLETVAALFGVSLGQKGETELTPKLLSILMEIREEARSRGDFKTSDLIRLRLAEAGVIIEDTPKGPVWIIKKSG
ncbi:MAG: cysteine--tRNA ligase [Thermoprotei archaeon]